MLISRHALLEVAMSDRLHKEIDELLAKLDTFPPRRPLVARARDAIVSPFRSAGRWLGSLRLPQVSAGHILLLAIAVIVIAYLAEPGGDSVTRYLIVGGIVLFIAAFVLSLRRPTQGPHVEKRWRGQPMDLHGPSVGLRLRSWWQRRRSPRDHR